jgi:hypothetical protein
MCQHKHAESIPVSIILDADGVARVGTKFFKAGQSLISTLLLGCLSSPSLVPAGWIKLQGKLLATNQIYNNGVIG